MTCHTLQSHALGDKENALRNKYHLSPKNTYILFNSSLKNEGESQYLFSITLGVAGFPFPFIIQLFEHHEQSTSSLIIIFYVIFLW